VFDAMTEALARDDRIEIRGFGSFSVRRRRSRQGRNPKTGASIQVPEKRVPFFTVGHELKERVDSVNRSRQGPPPRFSGGAPETEAEPLPARGA
jgi:integration host factor subunit beta